MSENCWSCGALVGRDDASRLSVEPDIAQTAHRLASYMGAELVPHESGHGLDIRDKHSAPASNSAVTHVSPDWIERANAEACRTITTPGASEAAVDGAIERLRSEAISREANSYDPLGILHDIHEMSAEEFSANEAETAKFLREIADQVETNLRALIAENAALRGERDAAKAGLAYLLDCAVYGDSYGVHGSDFQACHFCQGGGAPGVALEHSKDCPISRYPSVVTDWFEEMEQYRKDCEASEAREAALRERAERAKAIIAGLFAEGFLEAGTRITEADGHPMQWACELDQRLTALGARDFLVAISPAQASPKAGGAWRPDREAVARSEWENVVRFVAGLEHHVGDPARALQAYGQARRLAIDTVNEADRRALPAAAPDQTSKDREDGHG